MYWKSRRPTHSDDTNRQADDEALLAIAKLKRRLIDLRIPDGAE